MTVLNTLRSKAFGLAAAGFLALGGTQVLGQGQASVQFVHNSPEPLANTVDVIIFQGTTEIGFVNDISYRDATPFQTISWGVAVNPALIRIGVCPSTAGTDLTNGIDISDTLASFPLPLANGDTKIAVADGLLAGVGAQAVNIRVFNTAQESSAASGTFDVLFYHGGIDVPRVAVHPQTDLEEGANLAGNTFTYGTFAGYVQGITDDLGAAIRLPDNGNTFVTRLFVPGEDAASIDLAAMVMASGYAFPVGNQPALAFFVVLPDGDVFEMDEAAIINLVHNAADPAALSVDFWYQDAGVNDIQLADNFAFRRVTGFFPAPVDEVIGVDVPTSMMGNTPLATFTIPSTDSTGAYIIANGVLDPSLFAVNPNGQNTGFTFLQIPNVRPNAAAGTVDIRVLHGATDATAVRIRTLTGADLVANAQYSQFTNYIGVPTADYLLMLQNAAATAPAGSLVNDATLTSLNLLAFNAPLQTFGLGGRTALVFASGFLNIAANGNNPATAFSIMCAVENHPTLGDTAVVLAPGAVQQFIHASPDPSVDSVDFYMDGQRLVDNLGYPTWQNSLNVASASPYIWVRSVPPSIFGVAGKNSASVADTLIAFGTTTNPGQRSQVFIRGTGTGIGVTQVSPALTSTTPADSIAFRAVHLSPDAPAVNLEEAEQGLGVVATNLSYLGSTPYFRVNGASFRLNVRLAANNNIFRIYKPAVTALPLLGSLEGVAAAVYATGYVDTLVANPTSKRRFALYGVVPTGQVFPLTDSTDFLLTATPDAQQYVSSFGVFPNPASSYVSIEAELVRPAQVQLNIADLTGRTVLSENFGYLPEGVTTVPVNLNNLSTGVYSYTVQVGEALLTGKLVVQ